MVRHRVPLSVLHLARNTHANTQAPPTRPSRMAMVWSATVVPLSVLHLALNTHAYTHAPPTRPSRMAMVWSATVVPLSVYCCDHSRSRARGLPAMRLSSQ